MDTMAKVLLEEPATMFAVARDEFKRSLPETMRKKIESYQNVQMMVEDTSNLVKKQSSRRSKLREAVTVVDRLGELLKPYFRVVDIYVSSKPEYAALVWGTLRLIFQMASNFTSIFEKIERMLLKMAYHLPDCTRFLERLDEMTPQGAAAQFPRLTKALAYMYEDILAFSQRVFDLLSGASSSGKLSKLKLYSRMAWTPFESHFEDIIENFKLHSKLFRVQMTFVSSETSLDIINRFEENRLNVVSQNQAAELNRRWDEWEAGTTSMITKLLTATTNAPRVREHNSIELGNIDGEIDKLIQRIHAPAWSTVFEHARRRRVAQSGEWLLEHPIFKRFWDTSNADPNHRVLFMRGKPGYGKTTLATLIIDHLKSVTHDPGRLGVSNVLYFFFDGRNQMSQANSVSDAVRALLTQLIFIHRTDPLVLDLASLVRPSHDTGQQFASEDEAFALLRLVLLHTPNCAIVCDGIDECADSDDFLRKFESLVAESKSSRFVFLARPVLKLHASLDQSCVHLGLEPTQNLLDLRQFIEPRIYELYEIGDLILPHSSAVGEVTGRIAQQASGIFLWTALFLKFLESPSFSPSARLKIIEDPTAFSGLHNIYQAIFNKVDQDNQGAARINIRRSFQWVLGALRPLHIDELRLALAQEGNRSFDEADAIPKLEDKLSIMTGALIEVTESGTVQLIHHTVADFLLTELSKAGSALTDETSWDFRPFAVQHYICTTCLAFLRFTLPTGPYKPPFALRPSFSAIRRNFPLIDFAAQFWIAHLIEFSRKLRSSPERSQYLHFARMIGDGATALIRDKRKFTTLAECIWQTGNEDAVWPAEDEIIGEMRLSADIDALEEAFSLIRWAFVEHNRIPTAWRQQLEKHPEKIWVSSLPTFSNSDTLVGNIAASSSTPIAQQWELGYSAIVILTQLSATGHAIGIISVKPPYGETQISVKNPMVIATYQIRTLDMGNALFETSFEIKNPKTLPTWRDGSLSFSIDASISDSLLEVVVENTLIKLSVQDSVDGYGFCEVSNSELDFLKESRYFCQMFDVPRKISISPGAEFVVIGRKLDALGTWAYEVFRDPNCRRNPSRPQFFRTGHIKVKDSECNDTTGQGQESGTQSSDTASVLIRKLDLQLRKDTLLKQMNMADVDGVRRILHKVGKLSIDDANNGDEAERTHADDTLDSGTTVQADSRELVPGQRTGKRQQESAEAPHNVQPTIHFHPTKPIIALVEPGGVYMWNFSGKRPPSNPIQPKLVIRADLEKTAFSDDGKLFYGIERDAQNLVLLDVFQYFKPEKGSSTSETSRALLSGPDALVQSRSQSNLVQSIPSPIHRVQTSNSALIAMNSRGNPTISVLDRHSDDGSLIQTTLDSERTLTRRKVLDLPNGLMDHATLSLLYPWTGPEIFAHGGNRKVVIGVSPKEWYSFGEKQSVIESSLALPAVFEQQSSSITTFQTVGHSSGAQTSALMSQGDLQDWSIVPRDTVPEEDGSKRSAKR